METPQQLDACSSVVSEIRCKYLDLTPRPKGSRPRWGRNSWGKYAGLGMDITKAISISKLIGEMESPKVACHVYFKFKMFFSLVSRKYTNQTCMKEIRKMIVVYAIIHQILDKY